ncbi:potassium channel family protein [Planctomycetota bacterium]
MEPTDEVHDAISFHHSPADAIFAPDLTELVSLASNLSREWQIGYAPPNPDLSEPADGVDSLQFDQAAIIALTVIGTVGYTLIESWPIRDGFYMTVVTLSTVGYGETRELSRAGRVFTSAFILLCLFTMAFWSAALTSCLVEGDLSGSFQERKTRKMISKLKGHAVVCGSCVMAEAIATRLLRKRRDVVLIDSNKERGNQLKATYRGLFTVIGDPTNELEIAKTNLLDASTVVSVMESDLDNLLVGITCKGLGTEVFVFARSDNRSIANRMRKAGIDEIIAPSEICGDSVARTITANADSAAKTDPSPKPQALQPSTSH